MQPKVSTPRDPVRSWLSVGIVAGLAFGAGLWLASSPAVAQQAPSTAVCTQMPQRPNVLVEDAVAAWMNEQIAAGRTRFESLTGLTTVLCAW